MCSVYWCLHNLSIFIGYTSWTTATIHQLMDRTDTNHHPNFVTSISLIVRKTRIMALSGGEKFWPYLYVGRLGPTFSRFVIIPQCHGLTNGRTELLYQYRQLLSCLNTEFLLQKYYASSWQGVRTHLVCLRHCFRSTKSDDHFRLVQSCRSNIYRVGQLKWGQLT